MSFFVLLTQPFIELLKVALISLVWSMRVVVDLLHVARNMLGSCFLLNNELLVFNNDVYPVILSGGSGTRLWPLSRQHYPKQFLPLNSEFTLLQEAAMRLRGVNSPIMVCNEIHRFVLAEQLQQIGVTPSAIFLEPVARNTAPAIALAAFEARRFFWLGLPELADVCLGVASDPRVKLTGCAPNRTSCRVRECALFGYLAPMQAPLACQLSNAHCADAWS